MVENLFDKLRRAPRYNSDITEKLHWRMREGTPLGRAANFLIWTASQVEYRTRRLRGWSADHDTSSNSTAPSEDRREPLPPWSSQLTEASHHSLGGRILIVAELSIRQCTRYRVAQKVEMFRRLGHETSVCSWTDAVA